MIPTPPATATESLAAYVADLTIVDLPTKAIQAAKTCLMDTIACIIGGASLEPGQILVARAIAQGGRSEATLLGQGARVPATVAALTNGNLANVLDFDDTLGGACHPGGPVVAAALAAAEKLDAPGHALVAGIVAGYEVTARLGAAIAPSEPRRVNVKGLATYQTLGAAAATARVFGFSNCEIIHTFGTAAASAPVPFVRKWGYRERPISWVKNNHGAAASAAVMAAELVANGFQASRTILDGPTGFWIMAGSDQWNDDMLLTIDSCSPAICTTSFKPYPCCRFLHPSIDAALRIREGGMIDSRNVHEVVVEVFSDYLIQNFLDTRPANAIDAQFSLPHAIAVGLCGNPEDPAWFRPPLLADNAIRAIAKLVDARATAATVAADGTSNLWSAVTVTMKDGTVRRAMVDLPRGEPENPLSFPELTDKFVLLTESRLGTRQAIQAIDVIGELESLPSLAPLTDLLKGVEPM